MARSKPTPENKSSSSKSKTTKDCEQKTKRVPRGSKRDWSQYSHNLPRRTDVAKNGRQTGRNLIAWTRPRMVEKLLLHIEYEALLHNRPIPWDAVAHRFNPGSSGDAITQRLMRMRRELIAEGHLVPPYPQKPGGPIEDVAVRGLVRANPDRVDDAYTTRKVPWTEPIDDLKKPLGNAVYALQGRNNSNDDEDDNDNDSDEDDNDTDLDQRNLKQAGSSRSRAVPSSKGKGLARPAARPARPARSTAKNMSYAEDEDDFFDGSFNTESEVEDDGKDEDEDEDSELRIANGSRGSSRASRVTSRVKHAGRAKNRVSGDRSRGLRTGLQDTFGQHPFAAATPGARGLGANHMSPYGMTPNGVHWIHSPMGLPLMPFGVGVDMMSGLYTTPNRSSAFTTHATSPADFDIEDASPRSAAFFQAHLNEYNSPTPRGYADFTPMVPMPMGLTPSDASMMPGSAMLNPGLNEDTMPMVPGIGDSDDKPQEPSEVEFSSMFSDAESVAKRLKSTNERG